MPLHVSIVSVKNYKYIRVYSSYRNEKGQPRSRLIENHGRLDAALLKDPQYVEKLKERIAKENQLEASTKAQEVEKQAKESSPRQSRDSTTSPDVLRLTTSVPHLSERSGPT